jgi:hypothetical protein
MVCLPSKHEALSLSSNSSTIKKTKQNKKKNQRISQMNNLMIYLRVLEKQEQAIHKITRQKIGEMEIKNSNKESMKQQLVL